MQIDVANTRINLEAEEVLQNARGTPPLRRLEKYRTAAQSAPSHKFTIRLVESIDQGRTLEASGANPEVYVVAWLSDTLQHPAYPITPKLAGGLSEVCDSAWSWAAQNVYCSCPCHTDPQCDGQTNVLDVVFTVNVAFRGAAPVFDDGCPYERTDVDCTGFTNVIDVVKVVNVAFRGGTPEANFCDGCG